VSFQQDLRLLQERRRGVSELTATIVTIAITIVAAASIFGYVNEQAGMASQAYAAQAGNSISYLNEKFSVVDMVWSSTTANTVWIYNTGKVQLTLLQIRFYDSQKKVNLFYNYSKISGSVVNRLHDLLSSSASRCGISATAYESPTITGGGSFAVSITYTGTIKLTIPPTSAIPAGQNCPSFGQTDIAGDVYFVSVVGTYGNSVTYSQVG
jgi:flagellin-like protein